MAAGKSTSLAEALYRMAESMAGLRVVIRSLSEQEIAGDEYAALQALHGEFQRVYEELDQAVGKLP